MRRAIRLEAGISQTRMAKAVGVHRLTLARWEPPECRTPRGVNAARYLAALEALKREAAS
jgi:DNA-binding XRE family transcriptional regulator